MPRVNVTRYPAALSSLSDKIFVMSRESIINIRAVMLLCYINVTIERLYCMYSCLQKFVKSKEAYGVELRIW